MVGKTLFYYGVLRSLVCVCEFLGVGGFGVVHKLRLQEEVGTDSLERRIKIKSYQPF